ncbi:MAG: hypothetical protein PHX78_04375 [bacterium]|nr:hypothetical protein [bacterium]
MDNESPVQGKTFSLYGNACDTNNYYNDIDKIIRLCLEKCPDRRILIHLLEEKSGKGEFHQTFINMEELEKLIT